MVRTGLLALSLLAGCTGEILAPNLEGLSTEERAAQQAWVERALPILGVKCVMCHDGSMPNIGYIAGADDLERRETLVNYVPRVVNLTAPRSSRMLSKGDHTATGGGPALLVDEATEILVWIRAEAVARPSTEEPLRTAQITPMVCTDAQLGMNMCPVNSVDLSSLGVPGTLEFVVQNVAGDAYFTSMKIKAGAQGIYLEHPLFESYPAGAVDPEPDPTDRFFATTVNLMPNTEAPLGTGTTGIAGFLASDPMSFRFDVVEAYRAGQ